jgi:hypothetical protein
MGAIIEAVQTSQHPDTAAHNGVVCIFCGLPTPVRTSGEGTSATHEPRPHRVSIVRCGICGKEAPYRAHEITEFGAMLREPSGILWFAKDTV